MERIGEITSVGGDWIEVTFCRETDCGHCHACMGTKKNTAIRIKGEGGHVGDCAVVEMGAATVTKASALAYAIPLGTLLAGMGIAVLIFPSSDAAAALGAVLGLAAGLSIVALTERQRRNDPRWIPQLKEIIPQVKKAQSAEA